MERRQIVAMGGGGFSVEPENELLDQFVLSLARSATPRVCFLPTASGDSEGYVAAFYRAYSRLDCRPTDLSLFQPQVDDVAGFLLGQDVIYVGGGNTANLLAIWRVHGIDRALRRAWREGAVLCGLSAGMNCWFSASVTDSFGSELAALPDGLGLISGSSCPHYDGEEKRRPAYREMVHSGALPAGWAADDGVGLVFEGKKLREVVSSRPDATAYRVRKGRDGTVQETVLEARFLGD